MHQEVLDFFVEVRQLYADFFTRHSEVLDIGSRDINGSLRQFFPLLTDYLGIDLSPGPGVDMVCHAKNLAVSHHKAYDVIVSSEALEHDKYWAQTLESLLWYIKPHGLIVLTCAGPERGEHGTTSTSPDDSPATVDYYGNRTIEDFEQILKPETNFQEWYLNYARGQHDLQFWGISK